MNDDPYTTVYEYEAELDALGVVSDYIIMTFDKENMIRRILPCVTPEGMKDSDWATKGMTVRYRELGGWDYCRKSIEERHGVKVGDVFTVKRVTIGRSNSSYKFEEIAGEHNCSMFERTDRAARPSPFE